MERRTFLKTSTLALGAGAQGLPSLNGGEKYSRKLGLTIWSYNIRWRKRSPEAKKPGWRDALDVLDHCHEIGAGCLQIGVKKWTEDFAGKVREKREDLGIALEGQIGLPWKDSDVEKFERGIRAGKEAGATLLRTTCLGGRRYEFFDSMAKWKEFQERSYQALERALPLVEKHGVSLAVENHKDWRIEEQRALFEHLGSEHVGLTFDFGNNFSLLEHPHTVAEKLAPYIMSTHVKDMALAEYDDGFLLSEVPLGDGVLDLKYMMDICTRANPSVWFNLEMITRDPLLVPVYGDKYWITMPKLAAPDLASTLKLAKQGDPGALPKVSGRDEAGTLAFEDANVRQSFQFAEQKLGMG